VIKDTFSKIIQENVEIVSSINKLRSKTQPTTTKHQPIINNISGDMCIVSRIKTTTISQKAVTLTVESLA
jgi:hypothetical protein